MALLDALQRLAHFLLYTTTGVYILAFAAALGAIVFVSRQSHIIANTLGWIMMLGGIVLTLGGGWGFVTHPAIFWFGYMIAGLVAASIGRHIMDAYGIAPLPAVGQQPQMPMPPPRSPYQNAGNASSRDVMNNFGGRQQRRSLDSQNWND